MAEEQDGPFKLSRTARGLLAVVCVELAGAHYLDPALPIDAIFLGLLGAGAAFLYASRFKLGPVDFDDALLKGAERRVESLPDDKRVALPPPAPVGEQLAAALAAPAAQTPPPAVPPSPVVTELFSAIEAVRIESIVLAGNTGRLVPAGLDWNEYDPVTLLHSLSNAGLASSALIAPLATVLMVRDDVVVRGLHHVDVRRATEIAHEVHGKLRAIKRNYHRVLFDSVALYEDEKMTTPFQAAGGVHGLLLAELDDGGSVLHRQVFPSARGIARGFFVSWEWDLQRVIRREVWYRHPQTDTVALAWSAAATFDGRAYPPQWHLEERFPNANAGLDWP